MNIYAVGGAIRDELLGVPVTDRDYVVVGATPEQMAAQGYRPVGKDFPVFLHPQTHEEYALARTERKTAAGYHGFQFYYSPDVTLEEDLARRDLTINAMARAVSPDGALTGPVIDPFDGRADLEKRLFRHVGAAFVEDPVRILRIARFAARFADFRVADETRALMTKMVEAGEVDALVPERVWQEVSRGLMEATPSRMFGVLRDCGALARVLPEIDALWGVPQRADYHPEVDTGVHVMMVLDYAASQGFALPVRFAALTHDLGKATTPDDILPRHIGHEGRSVDLLAAAVRAAARAERMPRSRAARRAGARQHSSRDGNGARGAGAPVRALRCAAQAGALRGGAAGVRCRRARAARDVAAALSAGRSAARGTGGGACRRRGRGGGALRERAGEDQGRGPRRPRGSGEGGAGKGGRAVTRCAGGVQSARAISDSRIESSSVDMNGNGYSRPNRRSVKSPGRRPMPSFLSHGQHADRIDSATKVVSSQRIMTAHL